MKGSLRTFSCRVAGLAVATIFALAAPPAALADHTHVVTPSTWTLNVAKSDFGGAPGMKSDVMVVTTDTEKWFTFSDTMVEDNGKITKSSWSGPQNGTMRPVKGMPGTTASFNSANDKSHWVMADGSVADSVLELAADKKSLVLKMIYRTKDGKEAHQTLVYERTK